ncbi:MAG: hypothetical protein ACAI25_05705 [Planctomycetota bacterium]
MTQPPARPAVATPTKKGLYLTGVAGVPLDKLFCDGAARGRRAQEGDVLQVEVAMFGDGSRRRRRAKLCTEEQVLVIQNLTSGPAGSHPNADFTVLTPRDPQDRLTSREAEETLAEMAELNGCSAESLAALREHCREVVEREERWSADLEQEKTRREARLRKVLKGAPATADAYWSALERAGWLKHVPEKRLPRLRKKIDEAYRSGKGAPGAASVHGGPRRLLASHGASIRSAPDPHRAAKHERESSPSTSMGRRSRRRSTARTPSIPRSGIS